MGNCIKLGGGPVFKPTTDMKYMWNIGRVIGSATIKDIVPVYKKLTIDNFVIIEPDPISKINGGDFYSCDRTGMKQLTRPEFTQTPYKTYNSNTGVLTFYEHLRLATLYSDSGNGKWRYVDYDRYFNVACLYSLSNYIEDMKN